MTPRQREEGPSVLHLIILSVECAGIFREDNFKEIPFRKLEGSEPIALSGSFHPGRALWDPLDLSQSWPLPGIIHMPRNSHGELSPWGREGGTM